MSNIEIERKFLVKSTEFLNEQHEKKEMKQGYLCNEKAKTVRVRTDGINGYLTIKGVTNGIERKEYEYHIPLKEAEELITMCDGVIEKTRHYFPIGKHVYEVDVFEGENKGLIVAEIELQSSDEEFIKPDWLGEEVSHDVRYFNAQLIKCPFTEWK